MPAINFLGGSKDSWSSRYLDERSINWIPELDPDGRYVIALRGSPGLTSFATVGSGPHRGAIKMGAMVYVISGAEFYQVESDGTATLIGPIVLANARPSMATNGTQIMIAGGPTGYIYTVAGGLVTISDPDFPGADTVVFQDGYFLFSVPGTGRFMITAAYDGTSVDATEFATAEGHPDDLIALASDHREPWLFGKSSIEVWYNSGNQDFPYERNPSVFIEEGCAAAHSIAKVDNTLFWLGGLDGEGPTVYRADGYTPRRVSFHGLEERMRKYTTVADAFAYSYREAGHWFYVITFPTSGETWAYDAATGLWHERHSWGLTRHRSNTHVYAFGKHLVGDYEDGTLWEQSLDVYDEGGNPLVAERRAKRLHNDGRYLFIPELELFFDTGLGLATGQGSDPQASLSWSDDGGHTWSNNFFASLGKIGEYKMRVIWRRLGVTRDRSLRVRVSDPIPRYLVGARV
jgi:hypothetical protein